MEEFVQGVIGPGLGQKEVDNDVEVVGHDPAAVGIAGLGNGSEVVKKSDGHDITWPSTRYVFGKWRVALRRDRLQIIFSQLLSFEGELIAFP